MLMLALVQFAQNVQKAYTFTDLKRSFTCPLVQWYKEPWFIDAHSKKSLARSMLLYSRNCWQQTCEQSVLYINSDWQPLVATVA